MKDYSSSIEDRREFILKYEVSGESLIIYLANKEKYIIPYTIANEKKILKRMKEQIPSKEERGKIKANFRNKKINLIYNILWIAFVVLGPLFEQYILFFSAICAGIFIGGFTIPNFIKAKQKVNDLKRIELWLNYQDELIRNIFSSINIYNGVSKKCVKTISKKQKENEEAFSINTISDYSIADLEQMIDNIKRQEKFKFEEYNLTNPELNDLVESSPKLSKKVGH